MLYGLLLEGVHTEAQEASSLQAQRQAQEDDESWWLGMEAWVCCEAAQTRPATGY
jgi:hypothetical protein